MLLGEGSVREIFSVPSPRSQIVECISRLLPLLLVVVGDIFFESLGRFLVEFFNEILMLGVDEIPFELCPVLEFFVFVTEHETFDFRVGVGRESGSPELVHLFVEVMDGQVVCFYLRSEDFLGLVRLFERYEIVVFLDLVVLLQCHLSDVGLRVQVRLHCCLFVLLRCKRTI